MRHRAVFTGNAVYVTNGNGNGSRNKRFNAVKFGTCACVWLSVYFIRGRNRFVHCALIRRWARRSGRKEFERAREWLTRGTCTQTSARAHERLIRSLRCVAAGWCTQLSSDRFSTALFNGRSECTNLRQCTDNMASCILPPPTSTIINNNNKNKKKTLFFLTYI